MKIDNFELIKLLSDKNMSGVVYKATRNNKLYAVKVFKSREKLFERFFSIEVEFYKKFEKFEHPGLLKYYESNW